MKDHAIAIARGGRELVGPPFIRIVPSRDLSDPRAVGDGAFIFFR